MNIYKKIIGKNSRNLFLPRPQLEQESVKEEAKYRHPNDKKIREKNHRQNEARKEISRY